MENVEHGVVSTHVVRTWDHMNENWLSYKIMKWFSETKLVDFVEGNNIQQQ